MSGGRILFCAPASGGGKTTVTCGFLQALVNRKIKPVAFKSGPDYIDPMFHSQIIGAKSRNLDLFLMGEAGVLDSLTAQTGGDNHDKIAVLEGAMGYYDGIAMGDTASAYQLAKITQTPAVLVVDGRGSALSICALIQGFLNFRQDSQIQGVIFNRISPMLYPRLKVCVEAELGIKSYGFLPEKAEFGLESRHLGLVTASEISLLQEKMQCLANQMEETIDISGLLELAATAPALPKSQCEILPLCGKKVRIAVARDKAFCFYYEDALAMLEQLGAELCYFSPLHDRKLPDDIGGLYLGGGYPELYARELSQNAEMRQEISEIVEKNCPMIAECGGFLYLHTTLEGTDGECYPMCDVISGHAFRTNKLGRFGYIDMSAQQDGLLCKRGDSLPAHEFHYWDSTNCGEGFAAKKPQSSRGWHCGHHSEVLYAGFPHCHLGGNPQIAQRFLQACAKFQEDIK